jgi:hypothetical protein
MSSNQHIEVEVLEPPVVADVEQRAEDGAGSHSTLPVDLSIHRHHDLAAGPRQVYEAP